MDLDFVVPTFREQRANRAVGETARENFLFRRPTFAFEITAGELACGSGPLAIIHGEREKILPGLGLGGRDGGDDDDGFAELHGDGTVGLFGDLAAFDNDGTASDCCDYFL